MIFCTAIGAVEDVPTIFAPGIISGPAHDSAPAFTPDGKTVYFGRSNAESASILVSTRNDDSWQKPVVAPFSGKWNDMEPAMSPDGSHLVFISNRPPVGGGAPVEALFNGKKQNGGNLWRVDRHKDGGWDAPVHLPERVNRSGSIFAPCVVADGSLYFMEAMGEKHRFRLFRSQWKDGEYQTPQPVGFSDGTETDVDPAVAPDESFAVFGSGRKPAQDMDLFIVFKDKHGVWQSPEHLGPVINSPGSDAEARFSPDLKTLYFSSERVMPVHHPRTPEATRVDLQRIEAWDNGNYNIWQTPLTDILRAHASKQPPGE